MDKIRVVLGDDHNLVRQGIRALLALSRICVVGEAKDGRELVRQVKQLAPEVALVDISLPLLNGIEVTRKLRRVAPKTRLIFLTMYQDKGYVTQAREVGAWGYVLKEEAPEQLITTIEAVANGKHCFPLELAAETVGIEGKKLGPREREVLQLIAEGKKNKDIARIMMRSLHTVRNHRANIMRKLGAHTAAELVQAADEIGLVRLEAVNSKP